MRTTDVKILVKYLKINSGPIGKFIPYDKVGVISEIQRCLVLHSSLFSYLIKHHEQSNLQKRESEFRVREEQESIISRKHESIHQAGHQSRKLRVHILNHRHKAEEETLLG